jgi:glycyl-tRNA synthetase beta chain
VPQECLILTMKQNQKYFPLLDAHGKLTNKFLVVSNIHPADAERRDRRQRTRRAAAPRRREVLLRPGSQEDARERGCRASPRSSTTTSSAPRANASACARSPRAIGEQLGGGARGAGRRAAQLAKADLLTEMVGEFPELQGIMGGYYALHDGEPAAIAEAIEDHYKPRFAGDQLPRNQVGICVALADKLETLVGLFGIGQVPTGDKDPFALRRHALGVIRMLVERDVGNILKKAEGTVTPRVDAALLKEAAELALNASLETVKPQADAAFERGDYTASLQALAALKAPVDSFFDEVMVNAEDAALRANRLGLLATLHQAMNRVADLSRLSA